MAEEKVTAVEETADDDLSKAWDEEVTGNKKPATPVSQVENQTPEVPASAEIPNPEIEKEHQESSKLGRKFKGLEDRFDKLLAKLETAPPEPEKADAFGEPEVISTPDDVMNVLRARNAKAQKDQRDYESAYLRQMGSLKGEDESLHNEIVAEMSKLDSPFNKRYGNDAGIDARINYAETKSFLLQKKYADGKPIMPKRETAGTPPVTPAATATRETTRKPSLPSLDKDAQGYVDYLLSQGVSEAEIAEVLK